MADRQSQAETTISPAIGERWRNKHTGKLAMVLDIRQETRHRPTGLAQAPDGRLIFLGDEEYHPTWIYFEGGAPPGWDDRKHGGWDLEHWLEHWERDEAESAYAPDAGEASVVEDAFGVRRGATDDGDASHSPASCAQPALD